MATERLPLYVSISYPRARPMGVGSRAGRQRTLFLAAICASATVGILTTGQATTEAASANAGPELTHLLRAMACLKLLFVVAVVLATVWRLGAPASWPRLAAYAVAGAAMSAGPGLIWDMAHVEAGALLMHAGLLASLLLLWRDPGTAAQLAATIVRRRLDQSKKGPK